MYKRYRIPAQTHTPNPDAHHRKEYPRYVPWLLVCCPQTTRSVATADVWQKTPNPSSPLSLSLEELCRHFAVSVNLSTFVARRIGTNCEFFVAVPCLASVRQPDELEITSRATLCCFTVSRLKTRLPIAEPKLAGHALDPVVKRHLILGKLHKFGILSSRHLDQRPVLHGVCHQNRGLQRLDQKRPCEKQFQVENFNSCTKENSVRKHTVRCLLNAVLCSPHQKLQLLIAPDPSLRVLVQRILRNAFHTKGFLPEPCSQNLFWRFL